MTDSIVAEYARSHDWIRFIRLDSCRERSFAAKIEAFQAGYALTKDIPYEAICSLDADISFEEGYFEYLLGKFDEDEDLGLAGTPFWENSKPVYDYRFVNVEHVSGACQTFRRECFEEIGGYVPLRSGGVDCRACIMARFMGWRTRTFFGQHCDHHRKMGAAQNGELRAKYILGVKDYALGNLPSWQICRAIYQMTKAPYVVGGVALAAGYFRCLLGREERSIPGDAVTLVHSEQKGRLRSALRGAIPRMLGPGPERTRDAT
jgi:hypothetical protein